MELEEAYKKYNLTEEQYKDIIKPYKEIIRWQLEKQEGKVLYNDEEISIDFRNKMKLKEAIKEKEFYKGAFLAIVKEVNSKYLLMDMKLPQFGSLNVDKYLCYATTDGIKWIEKEPTLEEAIKVLQKHFREDKSEDSIYTSFKDNIAMSFKDQFCKVQDIPADDQVATCLTFRDVHVISNLAAKNFLDNLIKE